MRIHALHPAGAIEQPVDSKPWWVVALRTSIGVGALATLALGAAALAPLSTTTLGSYPNPAPEYTTAMVRLQALECQDGPAVNTICRLRLLTHGHRTSRVVVLLHGVTNCPQQFLALGRLLHAQGDNVLIPRMPRNGLNDRMTTALKDLTAEELRAFTDTIVDIAHGLGQQVIVVGLSTGGVLAAWAAQWRTEVARAIIIAPSLGIFQLDTLRHMVLRNLAVRLPSWNRVDGPEVQARKPPHTYLRNSSRGMGEVLRLGLAVTRAARKRPAAAGSIVVVTGPRDLLVDNRLSQRLVDRWRSTGSSNVETYEWSRDHSLPHDVIDPQTQGQRVDIVYPVLIELIQQAQSARLPLPASA